MSILGGVCCAIAKAAISNVAVIHFVMARELYEKIASIARLVAYLLVECERPHSIQNRV